MPKLDSLGQGYMVVADSISLTSTNDSEVIDPSAVECGVLAQNTAITSFKVIVLQNLASRR